MPANTAALLATVAFALLAAGCGRAPAPAAVSAAPSGAAKAPEIERHAITGEVLRVEAERKVLIVKHDEIKGYMPAMTMEFLVSDGDLALARPGQRIRADMIPSKDGDFRLERIWPDDRTIEARSIATGAMQLRQDTHTRGKNAYREVGEAAPDFTLYDQDGRIVQGSRFRGRRIMLNFIFSRCPVPTMCPAATAKMISVQRLAKEAGVRDLELVSITLDPANDTPGVLREYAAVRGIDTSNFSFLTGPEGAIRDLLTQFGVITQLQGDILQHTLATLLIDPQGRIAHRTDGSQWEPQEFVRKMQAPSP
jgi:protein SCO1/2